MLLCFGFDRCLNFHFNCHFHIFLRIIGICLCDYLCILKKVHFDTLDPLDLMDYVNSVLCNEKLTQTPLKGCLVVIDDLCCRPYLVLFMFDICLVCPYWLRETITNEYSMVNSQNDIWLFHYEYFEVVTT